MASSINYKDTLFERSNLTTNRGEPTFETLHKLQNKIKANEKYIYSNIRGGSHAHIGLVLTNAQYMIILNTPFVYTNQLGTIIIPDRKCPTWTPTYILRKKRKYVSFMKWRELSNPSYNILLPQLRMIISRISAITRWIQSTTFWLL